MKSILIKKFTIAVFVITGISFTLYTICAKSNSVPKFQYNLNSAQTAPTGTKDSADTKSHTGATGYTGSTGSTGTTGLTGATGTPAPSGPGHFDDKTPPKK